MGNIKIQIAVGRRQFLGLSFKNNCKTLVTVSEVVAWRMYGLLVKKEDVTFLITEILTRICNIIELASQCCSVANP